MTRSTVRGPRRNLATRVHTPGSPGRGMTGLEVDERGRTGSRTCAECGFRLDDVDDRGTHPLCAPTAVPA